MKWWMRYAYNLETGTRAILGIYQSPTKPSDRSPFYYSTPIKTKWIKAVDADIKSFNANITFREVNGEIRN